MKENQYNRAVKQGKWPILWVLSSSSAVLPWGTEAKNQERQTGTHRVRAWEREERGEAEKMVRVREW